MLRIIISSVVGVVILLIITPIFGGILSDLSGSEQIRRLNLNWLSIIIAPLIAGYFSRGKGALIGAILSFILIGSTVAVWIGLLNSTNNEILSGLYKHKTILLEFAGYIVLGTISGWAGSHLYRHRFLNKRDI